MIINKIYENFFNGKQNFGAIGMHNFNVPLLTIPCRTNEITAYHILLTEPYCINTGETEFKMAEFELLTVELSAKLWRKYNGPIYLLTDQIGAEYFHKKHLHNIYDGIYPTLNIHKYGINPKKYWAFGKLQALLQIKAPCVVLDLDMLIWRPLDLSDCELATTHIEHITEWLYPEISFFDMSPRYSFPDNWDYTAEPLNTSFVYFSDEAFKNYYATQSIRFMQFERDTPNDGFRCMIFAEQRILSMCATEKKIKIKTLINYDNLLEQQNLLTHIWSGKKLIYAEKSITEKYITLCKNKIYSLKSAQLPTNTSFIGDKL